MKRTTNRPWRKFRRYAAVLPIAALAALAATPARAGTGGAATPAASKANAGKGIAFTRLRSAGATWYGPGLWGNGTACGRTLRPGTIGVAHRSLPCGTAVKFVYRGRAVVARVIDRGPYSEGNDWDLTQAAARALRFESVGRDLVRYAIPRKVARKTRAKRRSER